MKKSNIAVKRDWLTAGFARLQPAPYLQRYARTCANGTEVPVIFDSQDLIACISFTTMRIQDSRCLHTISVRRLIRKHCEDRSKKLVFRSHVGKIMPAIHGSLLQTA